ncbi:Small secreted domain [Lentzea xinjiangensis]|uniref:Small secreted domain n=1 Tax=Lentzea xinjiangensis TaxID=402600 RepID=A0A1H9A213_9PSEU|nr:chaplin family protein [Lentzea xinjiangensis]SEP70710.1 Small secreted domain [Lentzea xinjiangensis]
MQTWAKRGLQTAFVTGGLLMLGTGIASAQENVDPDAAPSAVDVAASIPVKADQNTIGTPARELNVPKIDRTVSTDRVTSAVPTRTAAPVANPLIRQTGERLKGTALQNVVRGNRIQGHLDVPINICGNAIAVLADAEASGDCSQFTHRDGKIATNGGDQALAGNVVAAGHALPVQLTGNAFGVGGNATTSGKAEQVSTTGGDITTSGRKGSLSGNVVAEQGATPVQVTGNGVGAAGIAEANSTADTFASSEGDITTGGARSSLSGNAVPVPVAPLFEVNGNSVSGAGNSTTDSVQTGAAYAGGKTATSGDPGTLAGNVAAPALAGPITVDDNAAAAVGNSTATSDTSNESIAGGETYTTGDGSTASGNVAGAPISLPVAAGGNGGAVVGNALTNHANKATSTAGGNVFTLGDNSVLSGNIADVPPATAVDVCGNGLSAAGQSLGTCENDVKSTTGGYQGTLGNDSVGSGNVAQTPLAAPVEAYAVAGTVAGQATGTADEVKDVRSSAKPNAQDDRGTVSSNIVTAPTAVAPQVFAVTAGVVGNTTSDASNDTSVTAGDAPVASGKKSSVAGNIVQVPTSTPAQVFGDGVTVVGNNNTTAANATDMKAGGEALTTGERGSIAGNVVSAPVATGTQVVGWAVGGGSNVDAIATNDLDSVAGGDVHSNGDRGSVSGNLVGAQPAVFPAVPGDSVAAGGITNSDVLTDTRVVSGGDSASTADDASVSGNLAHAPANVAGGVYADAVAVAGNASTVTEKVSHTEAGGDMATNGSGPSSAREMTVPVEGVAKFARVPVEVVGQATTLGTSDDAQLTGEEEPGAIRASQLKGLELPKGVDRLLKANEVPALNGLDKLPINTLPNPAALTGMAGQLPLSGLPISGLPTSGLPLSGLPVKGLPTKGLPTQALSVKGLSTQALPTKGLPTKGLPTKGLPTKGVPTKGLPTKGLPTKGLPTKGLPTQALPTRALPTQALTGVAKKRSALPLNGGVASVTPNVQGLPLAQVLKAAQGLVPGGVTPRSMPTVPSLPVTAPALPVPVQLPALPTERSLPTLPVDGPASISGLNLNPTKGLTPSRERALPEVPLNAPALSLIEPANQFDRVTGSL